MWFLRGEDLNDVHAEDATSFKSSDSQSAARVMLAADMRGEGFEPTDLYRSGA